MRRLKHYAKALGATVRFERRSEKFDDQGYCEYSPKQINIVVFRSPNSTLEDEVLTLLHECGHLLDYVNQGRPHPAALPSELVADHAGFDKPKRKVVLDWEERGIKLMEPIAQLLDLSIAKSRLLAEIQTDLWVYRYFYKKGTYPSKKQRQRKYNQHLRKQQ